MTSEGLGEPDHACSKTGASSGRALLLGKVRDQQLQRMGPLQFARLPRFDPLFGEREYRVEQSNENLDRPGLGRVIEFSQPGGLAVENLRSGAHQGIPDGIGPRLVR
ncbi:MAG TPA: hypothetical protein VGC49_08770 [Solirubrobacterales bacterium]